jgi:hypothetical protein
MYPIILTTVHVHRVIECVKMVYPAQDQLQGQKYFAKKQLGYVRFTQRRYTLVDPGANTKAAILI